MCDRAPNAYNTLLEAEITGHLNVCARAPETHAKQKKKHKKKGKTKRKGCIPPDIEQKKCTISRP